MRKFSQVLPRTASLLKEELSHGCLLVKNKLFILDIILILL
jgi:hypothetical protein